LVVEDDENLVQLFNEVLSEAGYEITTMDSALGAAALVRHLQPCVVLLDLGLPFRPGTSLLDELKSNPETAGVPVVVVSGLAETLSYERRTLAAAVLAKPVGLGSLLDAIRNACSQSRERATVD